ncbi:MAG: hypothetical protein Q4C46_05665 [Bacillota bacterium]|nr:hypothetical protein [Bacillota bacterium]
MLKDELIAAREAEFKENQINRYITKVLTGRRKPPDEYIVKKLNERRKRWQTGYRKDGRNRDIEPARAAGLTVSEKKITIA